MATVSLSPTPVQLSAMSTRRVPLASNPNVANSPLRAASTSLAGITKRARVPADVHRDDVFGQPPPAKRQMFDHQRVPPSPSRAVSARTAAQRAVSARSAIPLAAERSAAARRPPAEKESDNIKQWRVQTRARFPKMVFYFESISDDIRAKLAKQVASLGAREEKFFSIDITHIVTTRAIPTEKPLQDENSASAGAQALADQPKTIDPSLLNRQSALMSKKRSVFDMASGNSRRAAAGHQVQQEEAVKRLKPTRSSDILLRAQAMGKKIWSLDKLQKILDVLLETDAYRRELGPQPGHHVSKSAALRNDNILRSLIAAERDHGPADRDPTVATKELVQFKGPYIYVYDMEEKTKPIMMREYAKVADKRNGEWPQFRIASQGRCPFVEDLEMADAHRPHTRAKERASKVAVVQAAAPSLKPPQVPAAKAVTGSKRSLAQMEDGHNRGGAVQDPAADSKAGGGTSTANSTAVTARDLAAANAPGQNAFMSRARAPHLLAGEPVASGLQASNITSAIRSQMVSSTTGVLGTKAGTSREIHGLQRKVLQKASTPAVSTQDLSSRQMAEPSFDSNSTSFARPNSVGSRKLDVVKEEEAVCRQTRQASRLLSRQESGASARSACESGRQVKKPRRDPKPGYCENCMDKFEDFDEHVLSRKHRRFADNDDNWVQLDSLLTHLTRRLRPDEEEY